MAQWDNEACLNDVYYLGSGDVPDPLHFKPVHNAAWEPFTKGTWGEVPLVKGTVSPEGPIEFAWSSGTIAADHVETEMAAIHLLSDHVFELFRSRGFTGWSTFSVELHDKNGVEVPAYKGLVVTGRCGQIDDARSVQTVLPPLCPGLPPRPAMVGVRFDPRTWDGSDIFSPEGWTSVFVLGKVKQALEEMRATNIGFQRITEMENLRASMHLRQRLREAKAK